MGDVRFVGSIPYFVVEFRDRATNQLVAASNVELRILHPDLTTLTVYPTAGAIDNPSTGVYERLHEFADPGYYRWRWEGELVGGEIAVDEGSFCARRSLVAVTP